MSLIKIQFENPEQKTETKTKFMNEFDVDIKTKTLPFKNTASTKALLEKALDNVLELKRLTTYSDIPDITYRKLRMTTEHKQYIFDKLNKLINPKYNRFAYLAINDSEEDSDSDVSEEEAQHDKQTNTTQNKSYIQVWFDEINNQIEPEETSNNKIDSSEDDIQYLDTIEKPAKINDELYKEDTYLQSNEITTEFIKTVEKNWIKNNYDISYLKSFTPKNKRWSMNYFLSNLADRELPNNFQTHHYLRMIFEIMSGHMPFKKVHVNSITQNYNAFTSRLFEVKSTHNKQGVLIDSLQYNPSNYMLYTNFELCEYLLTDFQSFVVDIDCEFKKVQHIRNGEDIIIEHNYNDETYEQLNEEICAIKEILDKIADNNNLPELKLYAYVMFGHDENDLLKHDFEAKKQWCDDLFTGMECIYEYNYKCKKVISVHLGVQGICYDRKQNDGFRRYLNKHVLDNGNKFMFVDSSIYNKTQHAWRFAYSRKNNQRTCSLKPDELLKSKEILLNLFGYPNEDDVIVSIPDEYLITDDATVVKTQKDMINNYTSVQSYFKKLAYESKEIELIHRLNKKTMDDFVYNTIPDETNSENELFNCQVDPRLMKALNYVKNNNVGYPNIRKAVFNFVNTFRNYYSEQGECVELLLNIDYFHTNGSINAQSQQFIPSLVKYAWKFEIKPISHKYDLSIYKKDTLNILANAVWKEIQLKHYLNKMLFKINDVLYLKTLANDQKQIKYIQTSFDKLNNIFNTGFWIMKRIKQDDKEGIKIYRLPATTYIRSINLTEYSGIEICSTDSYNFKNLYDKPIGITKDDNKIYDIKYKSLALHDMTPQKRPVQITNILKSILNNNNITEEQLTERINYFESIFAYKVQNPDKRIDIAPIICSKEGIGKNTYFKILKTALDHWVQDDLSWDIAKGNFNGNQQLNIIRAYDEVTSTKSSLDLMKRLITAETEDVNEKYEKQLKIKNIALKCFLTNNYNNNIISKTGENRRFLYYLPTTTTAEGQQITKENWWGIKEKDRIALGKTYFNYLLRLDVSNFDPCIKLDLEYIDDMNEFRDNNTVAADLSTQFITEIINILEIPTVNNMLFVPTQLIIDLANMCKQESNYLVGFDFDFKYLTDWYHDNITKDYTWNQKSLLTRLTDNDSIYKPKCVRTIKILNCITKNKELLSKYYDGQVRGYYI